MRKKLCAILILITAIFGCISLGACEDKDDATIHTIYTVGNYSGYRVDFVRVEHKDAYVNCRIVEYCVDDVYIMTRPDPSYHYFVYTSEKDYVELKTAYEQGLVTRDDIVAIAEAEKPHDTLKNEQTT